MKHYIKIIVIFFFRILLRVYHVFPVKDNQILFSSFEGKNYGCNPKYIFEYLYAKYGERYGYVWNIDDVGKIPCEYKVKTCRQLSVLHLFYLATSRVIISNQPILPLFPKRKVQMFINTTHGGGAYKKFGFNTTLVTAADKRCMTYMRNVRAKMINHVISSCRAYTEIFSGKTEYNIRKDRFLSIGMPRNDLFFSPHQDSMKNETRKRLGIDEYVKVVLYAPTYRGSYRRTVSFQTNLNINTVCLAVEERFGSKAIFLYRSHLINKRQHLNSFMDVTDYQDMQELLLIADIFITDYSSSVWDFSLTGKPGFLFTPDLQNYQKEVDFHTPIEDWPYPYLQTTDDLCEAILNYDEIEAYKKIRAHHSLLGSHEKGNATEKVCDIIKEYMETNK